MASVAVTRKQTICSFPFLIQKYALTDGTTGLAITHGEDRAPDLIQVINTTTNPTATEISVVRTSATIVTVDCESNAGTGVFEMYLIWLSQASGGISS